MSPLAARYEKFVALVDEDYRRRAQAGYLRADISAAVPLRVAVCEAAIDALSLVAIDGAGDDTAYVSTGGGWGNAGNSTIGQLLSKSPDGYRRDRSQNR